MFPPAVLCNRGTRFRSGDHLAIPVEVVLNGLVVSGSSIFVFVGKERKSDQIFIINVEELPGVVLVVPLSNYSRRHFPLVKKV